MAETWHLVRARLARELETLHGLALASTEASRWLAQGLGKDRAWLAQHGGETVPPGDLRRIQGWLRRARRGEPWPQILGWAPFFGRRFRTRRGVLVPQPESEAVVRAALDLGGDLGIHRCADVGCGAGNIGLTLALETDWEVTLTELDPAALRLARLNGRALRARARYGLGDLLVPVPGSLELVVANMPFVDARLAPEMASDFPFEPAHTMLAPDGGMGLAAALLDQAWARGARACIVEVGAGQGRPLVQRARDLGWPRVENRPDGRGQDRLIVVRAR